MPAIISFPHFRISGCIHAKARSLYGRLHQKTKPQGLAGQVRLPRHQSLHSAKECGAFLPCGHTRPANPRCKAALETFCFLISPPFLPVFLFLALCFASTCAAASGLCRRLSPSFWPLPQYTAFFGKNQTKILVFFHWICYNLYK